MNPGLSESFSLVELPRIAGVPIDQRVVIPHSQKALKFEETDYIHLGMSKSLISSYVLKPTPKLVWSFPLSSGTIVDSMDVKDDHYVVGLSERKKHFVKVIKKLGNEDSASASYEVAAPAVGIMCGTDASVYVLLKDGSVSHLEYSETVADDESQQISLSTASALNSLPALPRSSKHTVIYHTFISEHSFQHKSSLLLYITRSDDSDLYTCILLGIDGAKTFEIYSVTFERPGLHKCLFTYSDGVLYAFDKATKSVTSSSLMKPQKVIKRVPLKHLFKGGDPDKFGFFAPAPERLLFSSASKLFLVNFKYESLLDQFEHDPNIKLHLNFALPTQGSSSKTSSTYALYLGFNEKRKTSKLNYIQVEVGTNTLRESLGKSLTKVAHKDSDWQTFPDLNSYSLSIESTKLSTSLKSSFELLREKSSDVESFNKAVIEFFKGEEYKESKTYTHAITDKLVDAAFLKSVLSLIFTIDEKENVVQIKSESFVPEAAVGYLLSHPLFPSAYANGLLLLLSQLSEPELLRTAIEKCPALSIDDLTNELNNLTELADELGKTSEDISSAQLILMFLNSTIERLVSDFSLKQITKTLQEILAVEYDGYNKKLERMLGIFININTTSSWDLVQAVVDAGGLFNWSIPVIERLGQVIDSRVEALGENSYNLTLTNQALLEDNTKKPTKKKSAGAKTAIVDNIHEIGSQKDKLDALLTMRSGVTNRKLRVDEGIELAKKIPAYSREKLVL